MKFQKKLWDRAPDDPDREGWQTHIGSGQVKEGDARDLLTRHRLCGRPRVTAWYERDRDKRCTQEALRFSPACKWHESSAEKDARAVATVAFELGRRVGWQGLITPEDPGFKRDFHPSEGKRRGIRAAARRNTPDEVER